MPTTTRGKKKRARKQKRPRPKLARRPAALEPRAAVARAEHRAQIQATAATWWAGLRAARTRDLSEMALAEKRIGSTPTERLEWLLAFIRKDLSLLQEGERVALGYDLRAFEPGPTGEAWGHEGTVTTGPMPDETLGRLHEEIRAGLRHLTGKGGQWRFQSAVAYEDVMRTSPAGSKPVRFVTTTIFSVSDERAYILQGIKWVVLHGGERLNACPQCRWPFLALHKRRFCESKCAQDWHDNQKRTKRAAGKAPRSLHPPGG